MGWGSDDHISAIRYERGLWDQHTSNLGNSLSQNCTTATSFFFTVKEERSWYLGRPCLLGWPISGGALLCCSQSFSVSLNTEGSHLSQVFCTCCFSFLNVPPFHLAYSYSAFKSQQNYHFLMVAFPRSLPPTRLAPWLHSQIILLIPLHNSHHARFSACSTLTLYPQLLAHSAWYIKGNHKHL